MVSSNSSSTKSAASSSRTVSAQSSTNNYPPLDLDNPNPRVRRARARRNRVERARNKATSALRRPLTLTIPGHQPPQPIQFYSCSMCPETFPTYQALGGHQNAHRRERMFQRCILMMQFNQPMAENDRAKLALDDGGDDDDDEIVPTSNSDDVVYCPNPIRVAYPLNESQRGANQQQQQQQQQQQPSFVIRMGPRPTTDGPSPSWLANLLRPATTTSASAAAAAGTAPLATAYGPPQPPPRSWVTIRSPYVGLTAQIPKPSSMRDLLAHARAQPSFPPWFGSRFENGSSSATANATAINADRKGKSVNVKEALDEEKEDEDEEDVKKSWGRDLKLWP